MTTSNTTYLITGANRGLGKALVTTYLARSNSTVIAAVRDPSAAQHLLSLPAGSGSKIHLVKIDNAINADAQSAITDILNLGIKSLDVVIANAGIVGTYLPTSTASLKEAPEVMQVNTFAVLALYQAIFSANLFSVGAKFAVLGSATGSIGGIEQRPFPTTVYGMSKAALHWLSRKIAQENEQIISFVLDPGFVQTEMGNHGANFFGMDKAYQTVEETTAGLVHGVDTATKETHGGKWITWDGSDFPW